MTSPPTLRRTLAALSLAALPLLAAPPLLADAPHVDALAGPVHVSLPFEKYTLANGLEVILHPDHRTPVVAVNIWYHVGSKDDPAGKSGFAHLFEHVMFQGSRNVGEDLFFKYLERAGASERNGMTFPDRTSYFETVPTGALPLVLWLESDRMGFLLDHVNQETFASQREVVKNERRQRHENVPYGLVPYFVRAAVFPPSHPYHRPNSGSPKDLDAASLDDVKAFFKTFYVPNNATLVVAGDIDPAATKELVATYFATLPRGADPPVKTTPMPVSLDGEKRLEVQADVELPRLVVTWPTPPQLSVEDAQLRLVAGVLSHGRSSRLDKRLVYDLQIAQNVSAGQEPSQLASTFSIEVTLRKGNDPVEVLKIVDDELAKLRGAPPSNDELERARAPHLTNLLFEVERVTERANMLNELNQMTHDLGFFDKIIARYQAATPADVQAAAAR